MENVPHATVIGCLRKAAAFCLPSRIEPFGIAILEAGALRVPVVATRVGGIPEIVTDGITGRLVPADDVAALATALAELLASPQERDRLAENLHRRVRDEFTWQRACRQYLDAAGVA